MTKYLLYLTILLLPFVFATNPVQGVDLPIIRILIPLLFLIWLRESFFRKKLFVDIRPRFFFLILFLLLAMLSLSWAPELSRGVRKILFLFSIFPVYFVAFDFFKKNPTKKIIALKIIVLGVFIESLIGIFQFLLQFPVGINGSIDFWQKINRFFLGNAFSEAVQQYSSWLVNIGGETFLRAFGTFPDPHLFGFFLALGLPVTWYLFNQTRNNHYLAVIVFAVIAILFSFSRAGYLAMLVFIVLTIIFEFLRLKNFFIQKRAFSIAILLIATSVSFVLLFVPNPATQRMTSSFQLKEGSIQGRLEMWEMATQAIKKNLLQGVGIGNFSYFIKPSSDYREPIYAHNLFLDFGSEIGIVGIILLLFLFLSPLLNSVKKIIKKNNPAFNKMIFAFFAVFVVFSIFETPFYSIRIFPLFLIFLALPDENS